MLLLKLRSSLGQRMKMFHICTYIHMYNMYIYIRICVYTYMYIYTCAYTYMYMYVHMHMQMHMHMPMHMYMYMYMYMYIYICMSIYKQHTLYKSIYIYMYNSGNVFNDNCSWQLRVRFQRRLPQRSPQERYLMLMMHRPYGLLATTWTPKVRNIILIFG